MFDVVIWTVVAGQTRHSFWSQHEGNTRDMTPTRRLQSKLNVSVVLPTMIFSIIMMFDLLDEGRKTILTLFGVNLWSPPYADTERRDETLMSHHGDQTLVIISQSEASIGGRDQSEVRRGRVTRQRWFWITARSGAQECSAVWDRMRENALTLKLWYLKHEKKL